MFDFCYRNRLLDRCNPWSRPTAVLLAKLELHIYTRLDDRPAVTNNNKRLPSNVGTNWVSLERARLWHENWIFVWTAVYTRFEITMKKHNTLFKYQHAYSLIRLKDNSCKRILANKSDLTFEQIQM